LGFPLLTSFEDLVKVEIKFEITNWLADLPSFWVVVFNAILKCRGQKMIKYNLSTEGILYIQSIVLWNNGGHGNGKYLLICWQRLYKVLKIWKLGSQQKYNYWSKSCEK
jgi:hypothetical protein